MKIKVGRTMALVAGVLMAGPFAVLAHHSESAYDSSTEVTIEGTVTEVSWAMPHALFFLDAKREGQSEMESWVVEGPFPGQLESSGWSEGAIKVGDAITVTGHPARARRPMMVLRELTTADGKHFVARGNRDR